MKVLNIILSIFIFIFAAASAVCSYFLFEKRAQFVRGHEKMARAIEKTAKALDDGSGTTYANNLSTKVLAHDKYSDLDSKLPTLDEQVGNIVKQRDAMAEALANATNKAAGENGSSKKVGIDSFKQIDQYSSSISGMSSELGKMIKNRDKAYNKLQAIAENRGGINIAALKKGDDPELVFKAFSDFISNTIDNSNTYRTTLAEVAALAGGNVSVSDDQRDDGINEVKKVVKEKIGEVKTIEKKLSEALTEAEKQKAIAKKALKKEEAAKKNADKIAANLKKLRDRLGLSAEFVAWDIEEARAHLRGVVTGVSEEYGYFVINLGSKNSNVDQKDSVSGTVQPVVTNLTSGVELMIMRSSDKNDPNSWRNVDGAVINSVELAKKDAFVASSKIVKVGEKESVVDLPAGKKVKVGDVVLYKYDAK